MAADWTEAANVGPLELTLKYDQTIQFQLVSQIETVTIPPSTSVATINTADLGGWGSEKHLREDTSARRRVWTGVRTRQYWFHADGETAARLV